MEAEEKVVSVLYRILLGRDADNLGLETYSRMIRQGEAPLAIAAGIYSSDEFSLRLPTHLLKNERYAPLYDQYGETMLASGNYAEAAINFDIALALNPRLANAYLNRGRAFAAMAQLEEALVCFDLAVALAPECAAFQCHRSEALLGVGRAQEALAAADRAAALEPGAIAPSIARAQALKGLARLPEALACFDAVIDQHSHSADLHLARGAILEELRRPKEARDCYRCAAELDPSAPEPQFHLGRLAEASGAASEALTHFDRAVALAPDCFEAWLRRGALLAREFDLPAKLNDAAGGLDWPPAPEALTYILYSETKEDNVLSQLGRSEYSYFFVREAFRKMLETRGKALVVSEPEVEVDPIYDRLRAQGEVCVFLSFAPPHRSFVNIRCPTIPVFAWEFDTIPTEILHGDRLDDWRRALERFGCAIVHSRYAREAVARAMYPGFPVVSIPAPVWDRQQRPEQLEKPSAGTMLSRRSKNPAAAEGTEIKARQILDCVAAAGRRRPYVRLIPESTAKATLRFAPEEIVYATVLNPDDGRKNWHDLVRAFCIALAQESQATLVLKLVRHDNAGTLNELKSILLRLPPFRCRVVAIGDFLDAEDYTALVSVADFVVNTSFSEGQCLPLMEFMSQGTPAVAPDHTSMAEYVDPTSAFVIASHREPCSWPQDWNFNIRAHRYRMEWDSAVQALQASYRTLDANPEIYEDMGAKAKENLRLFCSEAIVYDRLRRVIALKLALDGVRLPDERKAPAIAPQPVEIAVLSLASFT
jgi:tetratricopeptide (TPR) repeat protein